MKAKILILLLSVGIAITSNAAPFRLLTLEAQSNETEPQVSILWLCVAGTFTAVVGYMVYELYHCAKTKLGPPSGTNTNDSAFNYTAAASSLHEIHIQSSTNLVDWTEVGVVTNTLTDWYFKGTNYFMESRFFRAWY